MTDDQIGAYWDENLGPELLSTGVPEHVNEKMRAKYIADVRANPEALRQVAAWWKERS